MTLFRIDRSMVSITENPKKEEKPEQKQAPQPGEDSEEQAQESAGLRGIAIDELLLKQGEAIAKGLVSEASVEAQSLRRQAEAELSEAKQKAEEIRESARREGFESGKREAEEQVSALYEELAAQTQQSLERVIGEIESGRERMIAEMEDEVIGLCFAILKKVAALDRARDGELFKTTIKKALSQMELNASITVTLSAEDAERFFPEGEAVFELGDSLVTAEVVSSQKADEGSIYIESGSEIVNAGVDSQLKIIELAFRRLVGKMDE